MKDRSAITKKLWENPLYRAKQMDTRKSLAFKENHSRVTSKIANTPEGKAFRSRVCKRAWRSPSVRRKRLIGMRKYHDSREVFTVACSYCKEHFAPRRNKTYVTKYCSRRCYVKSLDGWLVKSCSFCGTDFRIRRWAFEKKKHRGYLFCSQTCFWRRQLHSRKPNDYEKVLAKILKPFGFRYVGNGRLKVGTKFPDYVNDKKHLLIELFGECWHKRSEVRPRITYFRKRGFPCLVVWAKELRNPYKIVERVAKFMEERG